MMRKKVLFVFEASYPKVGSQDSLALNTKKATRKYKIQRKRQMEENKDS
jgi:hypothetical protein